MTHFAFHNVQTGARKVVTGFAFHEALRKAPHEKGWRHLGHGSATFANALLYPED